MSTDKYSVLDSAKMQRDIEEAHGEAIFDNFAVLDDAHRVNQIEIATGVEMSNETINDPSRLIVEAEAAIEESAGGAPEWVPENAKIHIDFINDRAWTEADGEVAINTLVGTDAVASANWGPTSYDPENLTANGYASPDEVSPMALIGEALSLVLSDHTIVMRTYFEDPTETTAYIFYALVSGDANAGVQLDMNFASGATNVTSWTGSVSIIDENLNHTTPDAINQFALTIAGSRAELAINGNVVQVDTLTSDDLPEQSPLVAAVIDSYVGPTVQFVTIYDALPDTTGLSALSEPV